MPQLVTSTARAITLLEQSLQSGRQLQEDKDFKKEDVVDWEMHLARRLEKVFGKNSAQASQLFNVGPALSDRMPARELLIARYERHKAQVRLLDGLIRDLKDDEEPPVECKLTHAVSAAIEPPPATASLNKVFLVHGHDDAARESAARFIERIGLEAVVLFEQPNRGQTVIEKFEAHADVAFAVVLMTPDDVGGKASAPPHDIRPRARQNVIFELGYFTAKLGRHKVCALFKPGVEVPSDYSGVVYIEMDAAGAWRLALATELRTAGLSVDADKLLGR